MVRRHADPLYGGEQRVFADTGVLPDELVERGADGLLPIFG